MTRTLLYFAWIRERIGTGQEEIALPDEVKTVSNLLDHLRSLGEGYGEALKHPEVIRVALDQEHVRHDALLGSAREIALFPPMTGG